MRNKSAKLSYLVLAVRKIEVFVPCKLQSWTGLSKIRERMRRTCRQDPKNSRESYNNLNLFNQSDGESYMKKKRIRVIKKGQGSSVKEVTKRKEDKVSDSAKQAVANVSSWVSEFQKRKRTETRTAFETLFSNGAQNAES